MSHHSSGRRHRHPAREVTLLRWVVLGGSSLIGLGLLLALVGVASTQRPASFGSTLLVMLIAVLAVAFLSGLLLGTGRFAATIFNTLKLYSGATELKATAQRREHQRHAGESVRFSPR